MGKALPTKSFPLEPLAGSMDVRAADGEVGFYNFRLLLNVGHSEPGKKCRLNGWKRFGAESPFGFWNQDFHDQLEGCEWSRETFTLSFPYGGTVGYEYEYWFPDYLGPSNMGDVDSEGPFCGYPPFDTLPAGPILNETFLCSWFLGHPYTEQGSNAGGQALSYADDSTADSVSGEGNIQWDTPHVQNGLNYLLSIENTYGPSQEIDDARHFLNNIYVPATNQSSDPQGEFSGTYGTVDYIYSLEYDAESGDWLTSYEFVAAGGSTSFYPLCNSGGPDFYATSYWSECYIPFAPGGDFGGYGMGDQIPVVQDPYTLDTEYCGEIEYRPTCREAPTLIFEAVTEGGRRRLVIGTKSKLAVLNEVTGNYRLLADSMGGPYDTEDNCGCSARRWRADQVGNIVVFTNDYDPVVWWPIDGGPIDCNQRSVDYIPDLLALGVSRARVVRSWQGFMIIANLELDGTRFPSRLMWSDLNAPLSYLPVSGSLAGEFDFGRGEQILAVEPLGGQLRIYTRRGQEKAMYLATIVGGDEVIHFEEIYRGPDGLEFPNSIINAGSMHVWLGEAAVFLIGEYDRTPQRTEWLYRADGAIYNGIQSDWVKDFTDGDGQDLLPVFGPINRERCELAVGFYDSVRRNFWFSWPTQDADCNDMSLLFHVERQHASLVDRGFTAGGMHRPDYNASYRDWLVSQGICDPVADLLPKEGEPAPADQDAPPADINEFCAQFENKTPEDYCEACEGEPSLLLADASDKCLKRFDPSTYHRETLEDIDPIYPCPDLRSAVYTQEGYTTAFQADPYDFRRYEDKYITSLAVTFDAEEQAVPNELICQIASGQQPGCLTWVDTESRELRCLTEHSEAEHATQSSRPMLAATYPCYQRGIYLAWRLYVEGTGGASCFKNVTSKVRLAKGDWR